MSFLSLKRIVNAVRYSYDGLRSAMKEDPAFQQEVILSVIFIPVALCLHVTLLEKALLIGSLLLVLIVELINTAVETLVNRVSMDIHPLSKKAKDVGSAAVFLAIILACLVWGAVLCA